MFTTQPQKNSGAFLGAMIGRISLGALLALSALASSVASAGNPLPAKAQEAKIVETEVLESSKVTEVNSLAMPGLAQAEVSTQLSEQLEQSPALAPAPRYIPQPNLQVPPLALAAASLVTTVPVKVIYVSENQPVQIVDHNGRLLQVIYLKKK
jgi:hypothetical protein